MNQNQSPPLTAALSGPNLIFHAAVQRVENSRYGPSRRVRRADSERRPRTVVREKHSLKTELRITAVLDVNRSGL